MEITKLTFWRAALAEFLATTIFLFVNCGVTLTWNFPPTVTQIALCFGLSIAVLAQIFGPTSGANINPAVSLGLFVGRRISAVRTVVYIVFQCAGGITGAAICYAISPTEKRGTLGNVALDDSVTRYQGFALEGVLTFLLVMTVLAATDADREDKTFGPALSIGLSVTVCHLVGIPYTGCGINPARALGPAVVMKIWPNYHWIYWAGPMVGGILAGGLYKLIFEKGESEKNSLEINGLDYIVENGFSMSKERANSSGLRAVTTGL